MTIEASMTGGDLTWVVRLGCGTMSVAGYLTQAMINDAALDAPRIFMEELRLKIDNL